MEYTECHVKPKSNNLLLTCQCRSFLPGVPEPVTDALWSAEGASASKTAPEERNETFYLPRVQLTYGVIKHIVKSIKHIGILLNS